MFGFSKKTGKTQADPKAGANQAQPQTTASKEETKQAGNSQPSSKEVCKITPGDYTIHVLIQKTKQLAIDENNAATIVVEVDCDRSKEYSKEYPNQTSSSDTTMMEHIFIEKRNQSVQDLQNMKIKITLLHKGVFKNVQVGLFEFDFSYIYFMNEHALKHKWVAVSNTTGDDYDKVSGFLKLSLSIHGASDTPPLLEEDQEDNEDVIMPSSIKPKFRQLRLHFIKGECLPRMDSAGTFSGSLGKMDAYLITEVNGKKLRTKAITTVNDEAVWNQTMNIPIKMPLIASKLIVKLYDEDATSDEICGSLIFDYKDLFENKQGSLFWVNIYGPPGGDEQGFFSAAGAALAGRSEEYYAMCHNPEIANVWKCRVLVGVDYEDKEAVTCNVVETEQEIIDKSVPYIKKQPFQFNFFAGSINSTPEEMGAYDLQVQIAEWGWKTKEGVVQFNFNRWNQYSNQTEILLPYPNVEDIGPIFIYLLDKKGNKISYTKIQSCDCMDTEGKLKWVQLQADDVNKAISSPELAGVVSFRISIVKGDKSSVNYSKIPNWSKTFKKRAADPVKARVFVYQARDLPAADDDGASDPFLRVFDNIQQNDTEKHKQTRYVDDTCFPMYYQCFELSIEADINNKEEFPPFIIDAFDMDKNVFTADTKDFLCRAIIPLADAAVGFIKRKEDDVGKSPVPKWHNCYFKPGGAVCGQILVAFLLAPEFDFKWKVNLKSINMMGLAGKQDEAVVIFDEYKIDISVLGLRNLVSSGLLPVKKAYVQFGLKTLVPPIAGASTEDVYTVPGPFGSDPTINTVISFRMLLPNDPLYAPSMACRVYDKIFTGFEGQLIGVFSIPIGEIMQQQRADYKRQKIELKSIIQKLKDILDGKGVQQYKAVAQKDLTQDEDFKKILKDEKELTKKVFPEFNKIPNTPNKMSSLLQAETQSASNLKRPLIQHTDEDSDEDGNTITNPIGIDSKFQAYEAPRLNFEKDDGPSPDEELIDTLKTTPRSKLTQQERAKVDKAILNDVIISEVNKKVNTLPKNVDPNDPEIFKPVSSPRVSLTKLDEAMQLNYSGTEDAGNKSFREKIRSNINAKVNAAIMDKVERDMRIQEEIQKEEEAEINRRDPNRANKTILFPEYKIDKRLGVFVEYNFPPKELFVPIGWDREPGLQDFPANQKHYRKFINQELETFTSQMKTPTDFDCYDIKRGQVRGANPGMLSGLFNQQKKDGSGEIATTKICGKFKGLIQIDKSDHVEKHKQNLNKKLSKIYGLLCEIHTKSYMKQFPFRAGLFREINRSDHLLKQEEISEDIKEPTGGTFSSKLNWFKDEQQLIDVMTPEGKKDFREKMQSMNLAHLQIGKIVTEIKSAEQIQRALLDRKKCIVRVYILSGHGLAQRDNDSPSDPYLLLKLGDQEFNDRENYIEDEPNPSFLKKHDFEASFPGCPMLKIQVWDYDLLFGDDLIGETIIDLEDRFFSADWNAIILKPVETRKLYHPSSDKDQGLLRMWVEILPTTLDLGKFPAYDISNQPEDEFEVRVCVFETEELKMMDVEGTTDGFVKVFFDPSKAKETDTHFRNQDGHCSWNYRMLHKINYPNKNSKLTVQVYDRDLFTSNELIGDSVIDLKPLFEDARLTKTGVQLSQKYYDDYLKKTFPKYTQLTFSSDGQSFWVNLASKNSSGKIVVNGRLRIQVEVLPKVEADKNKVGEAQSEPNVNPFLPKPENRMTLSLNPFDMIAQLVGPSFRRMGYSILLTFCCCALCIAMLPMILSNMFSSAILSIF